MTTVALPALRSDDHLGFLAAVGIVEACTTALDVAARLSWRGHGGPALLESDFRTTDELAEALATMATAWAAEGRVLPPRDASILAKSLSDDARAELRRASGVKVPLDPMRMTRPAAREAFRRIQRRELAGGFDGSGRWIVGLLTQLGLNDAHCEVTPLYSPRGRQTLHQLYSKYLGPHLSKDRLAEALTGWRRVPEAGANLDPRDERDAVTTSSGGPENMSVPAANWLALLAVPCFPIVGSQRRAEVVGWRPTGRGRPRELFWPVWEMPLDRSAIEVLLSHPAVRQAVEGQADADRLRALGVVAVLRSRRRALNQADGPLQRCTVMWP